MNNIKRLPDSELELMQIIWKLEYPVSRPDIEKNLPENHQLAATTILTLLTRLAKKASSRWKNRVKPTCIRPLSPKKITLQGRAAISSTAFTAAR